MNPTQVPGFFPPNLKEAAYLYGTTESRPVPSAQFVFYQVH